MKILPVNTYNYSHKNITKSNKSEYNTNNSAVRNPINTYQLGYYTYGINFGKLKSDKINYADTKEFSKYLHSKIEEKSITYKPEDIDIMISDVQDRTGAKEETVREVFARLVQFSTNSQLKAFEDALAENGIFEIREANNNLSTNNLLMYISKVKDQICPMKKRDEESERPFSLRYGRKHTDLNQTDERKSKAIILDDRVLDFYEKKKEQNESFFINQINMQCKYIPTTFFIVDGWNTQINGKKQIYTILGQSGSISDIAVDIINEMNEKNKSVDEVMNKPTLDRARNILGDSVEIKVLKSKDTKDISSENIARMMHSNIPDEEEIESFIDIFVSGLTKTSIIPKKMIKKAISKYLDNYLCSYSTYSMNEALKFQHAELQKILKSMGKSQDDVSYIIPDKDMKSFHLITNQYLIANNINDDNSVIFYNDYMYSANKYKENGVYVLLDDFSGSGISMLITQFNYEDWVKQNPNTTIVFAPIVATTDAVEKISHKRTSLKRDNIDYILMKETVDNKALSEKLKSEEKILNKVLGDKGYMNSMCCIVFPFSHPDNNTSLSHVFTGLFLREGFRNPAAIGNWAFNTPPEEIYDLVKRKEHYILGIL